MVAWSCMLCTSSVMQSTKESLEGSINKHFSRCSWVKNNVGKRKNIFPKTLTKNIAAHIKQGNDGIIDDLKSVLQNLGVSSFPWEKEKNKCILENWTYGTCNDVKDLMEFENEKRNHYLIRRTLQPPPPNSNTLNMCKRFFFKSKISIFFQEFFFFKRLNRPCPLLEELFNCKE